MPIGTLNKVLYSMIVSPIAENLNGTGVPGDA